MCRNTLPHSGPATIANVQTSAEFDDCSVNRNQPNPSRIISTPIRRSGRRRQV